MVTDEGKSSSIAPNASCVLKKEMEINFGSGNAKIK